MASTLQWQHALAVPERQSCADWMELLGDQPFTRPVPEGPDNSRLADETEQARVDTASGSRLADGGFPVRFAVNCHADGRRTGRLLSADVANS
jgi:hypothetical protein